MGGFHIGGWGCQCRREWGGGGFQDCTEPSMPLSSSGIGQPPGHFALAEDFGDGPWVDSAVSWNPEVLPSYAAAREGTRVGGQWMDIRGHSHLWSWPQCSGGQRHTCVRGTACQTPGCLASMGGTVMRPCMIAQTQYYMTWRRVMDVQQCRHSHPYAEAF